MHDVVSRKIRPAPCLFWAIAFVVVGTSGKGARAAYTVTNVSTAVANAGGGATANIDYGSGALSTNGSQVAGITSAGNPFLYTPGSGTATVLSSVTAVTVAVNNSGTVVGGNSSSTTPNFVYKAGTTTTVAASVIGNPAAAGYTPKFVSLSGLNNAGVASGYVQYQPPSRNSGSLDNEGIVYNTASGAGKDVGSGFSNQLTTQARGNVLYSVNDSGVGAGYGAAPNTTAPQVFYTATPNGSGGYAFNNLTTVLSAAAPNGSFSAAIPSYVGINSKGDVTGTFDVGLHNGFLYDAALNKAFLIQSPTSGIATDINGLASVNGVATVVGVSSLTHTPDVAIVYTEAGGYQTLASYIGSAATGYTLTSGLAISERGDILALGTNPSGVTGEYLFSVPEPTSLAVVGLGCLTAMRRVRRPSAASA